MQPSLFQPQEIEFTTPDGQTGPRLWIRRVALWRDASTLLRDIPLRQGVNIIWSPDLSTNENGATPHGSGKSTFCRLLRYCLGEPHFANDEQRLLMQVKLPDGFVGAEIIIGGECWVVTRPIGLNVPSRTVKADHIEDTLDQLLVPTEPPIISDKISDSFCTNYRNQVPDNVSENQVWEVILAWLARDQECRLDDVFDWRSKRSGSGSPAQELSLDSKLAIIRLAIGALSANEVSASAEVRKLGRKRDDLKRKLGHLDWLHKYRFEELADKLSVEKDRDPSDETVRRELIDKANERLAKLTGASHTKGQPPQTDISGQRNTLQSQRNEVFSKQAAAQALLDILPNQIAAARAEQGTEEARLEGGVIRRCSVCLVNIDDVLADGCKISREHCDLDAVRKRIENVEETVKTLTTQQTELPKTLGNYSSEIARLDRELDTLDKEFIRREKQFTESNSKIGDARELVREAGWFDRKMLERGTDTSELGEIETKIEGYREIIGRERTKVAKAIGDLEIVFQQLVASLMPKGCSGKIRLDGNGLHTDILLERGVGLSTAAVESFKIVAFDLAAMILAINGKANLPSLLIHDSPREADLDASIYSNLFDFVLGLEDKATPPPFQYIITTTTAPSDVAAKHPAMRVKLSSTPPEERLFGLDF